MLISKKNTNRLIYILIFYVALFGKTMALDKINAESFYTENQSNVIVKKSQPQFSIKLKSNPTTGYSWFLREYNSKFILPLKHQFEKPTKQLVGASGYEIWTFRVKPAGFSVPQQTQIRFVYTRPWQAKESASVLTFRVTMLSEN